MLLSKAVDSLLIIVLLSLLSCAQVSVEVSPPKASKALEGSRGKHHAFDEYVNLWFMGLLSTPEAIQTRGICPRSKLQEVEFRYSFEDVLLTLFSLGLYAPRTIRFWCEDA